MTAHDHLLQLTRRRFLGAGSLGLGGLALSSLLDGGRHAHAAVDEPFATRTPHFAPRAKNIIVLSMSGGPSQLEMFDYKPELARRTGEPCPASLIEGKPFAFTGSSANLLGTPQKFEQHGQCG